MSYSFGIKAANKAEALAEIEKKFDEVTASQPCHTKDKAAALANASTVLDLLKFQEGFSVNVNMSGSVSWLQSNPDELHGASVQCYAHLEKNAEAQTIDKKDVGDVKDVLGDKA